MAAEGTESTMNSIDISPALAGAAGAIQQALEGGRAQLSRAYSGLQDKSTDALRNAETYIRRAPFPAIGYAAALGVLIGAVTTVLLTQGGARGSRE